MGGTEYLDAKGVINFLMKGHIIEDEDENILYRLSTGDSFLEGGCILESVDNGENWRESQGMSVADLFYTNRYKVKFDNDVLRKTVLDMLWQHLLAIRVDPSIKLPSDVHSIMNILYGK